MIGERNIYSVSDVNRYIKAIISQDENLKFISVRGELSNFKRGANGHLYFSLKDKDSLIVGLPEEEISAPFSLLT